MKVNTDGVFSTGNTVPMNSVQRGTDLQENPRVILIVNVLKCYSGRMILYSSSIRLKYIRSS